MIEPPKLPPLPVPDPKPAHYARERMVNGVRYIYYGRYRCTVKSWENDGRPKWELTKRPRKTWQPNL
jgi:hypothetical protein